MKAISEYVAYLPPVLWSHASDPDQRLGRMLRIFERILTADDPDVPLTLNSRSYQPIEQTIDELPRLFHPWQAPTEALPRLASWLGVDLPSAWSEHQWRRLIAAAMPINLRRGTKEGLALALDIYADTATRPRIAVDDGEVVLRGRFAEDGTVELTVLASSTIPRGTPSRAPALIYPVAVAVDQLNQYLVADQGVPPDFSSFVPAIWQLSSTGEITYPRSPDARPQPRPLCAGDPLYRPVALAVDSQNLCYVLDAGKSPALDSRNAAIFRLDPNQGIPKLTSLIKATPAKPWAVCPVDMLLVMLDAKEQLVVLDRGVPIVSDTPDPAANQQIVIVDCSSAKVVKTISLNGIVEPTALCRWGDDAVLVADAGDQFKGREAPATLVRVDLKSGATTALLAKLPPKRNPLIFPTGLVVERPGSLIVCDTGVRWGFPEGDDGGQRAVAEPAALYRIERLGDPQPVITKITRWNQLVTPKKIALDRAGQLVLVDAGEVLYRSPSRNWRADLHTVGVVVLFSGERSVTPEQRTQASQEIATLVATLQPAQTRFYIDTYNQLGA